MKMLLTGLLAGLLLGVMAVLVVSGASARGRTADATTFPDDMALVTITLDETFVNQRVAAALKGHPSYSNPQVDLRAPDLARVTVDTRLAGIFSARPTLTLQFSVENGAVNVSAVGLDVGGLNVPRGLAEQQLAGLEQELETQINTLVARGLANLDLPVTRVSVSEVSLSVEFGE